MPQSNPRRAPRAAVALTSALAVAGLVSISTLTLPVHADPGLSDRLSQTREQIESVDRRSGTITARITRTGNQVDRLRGQVASLRNREAEVAGKLDKITSRLESAEDDLARARRRLDRLRLRLRAARDTLAERLVAIYKSSDPDAITVILDSDGYEDLLDRAEYLQRIERQDVRIMNRVATLNDEVKTLVARRRDRVESIETLRTKVAANRARLAQARATLAGRERTFAAALDRQRTLLHGVRKRGRALERIEEDLEAKVQAQLAAVASASPPVAAGPVTPVPGESSSGLIWPVNGPISSPFGPRWGRLHAGIDIAAPGGTPIRSAKSGTVVLAEYYGGYGNYTCVDHGGGLSTCYAHQSAFATSRGSTVKQGEVIGYVGNTGASFGDHLHFEVRVNGVPQDPMGYL